MPEAYVLDYVRTPRGKGSSRGALHSQKPLDLTILLQRALESRAQLDTELVDDVVLGCATQSGEQGANLARTATLLAGWGSAAPGVTLNRFCASGIDAVAQTAARIRGGDLSLAVAGGVESASRVPMFSDGGPLYCDPAVVARVGSVHMGIAADINATLDGWTREQLDAYGVETQTKAAAATAAGAFAASVVPVSTGDGGQLTQDECIRPGATLEALSKLGPAFAELGASGQDAIALDALAQLSAIEHLHTTATSPAVADGAALLLLGDQDAVRRTGLRPRARVVAATTAAADPVIMLTAGQLAVERVLAKAGLSPADVDIFEFAEAFAALCLTFRRDLGAGPDRMNPNGGTIAMGHAFGATGAIMVGGCVDELERRGGRYGVASVSGAAGLGVAVLVERLS